MNERGEKHKHQTDPQTSPEQGSVTASRPRDTCAPMLGDGRGAAGVRGQGEEAIRGMLACENEAWLAL